MNCICQFLIGSLMFPLFFSSGVAADGRDAGKVPHDYGESLLCGPNAIYLSLALVGKKREYSEVAEFCRQYRETGMSILEIEGILNEKFGVKTTRLLSSEALIAREKKNMVAIVLQERPEMSHLLVKHFDQTGNVRVLDPLGLTPYISKKATDGERNTMLLVGTEEAHSPMLALIPLFGLGIASIGGILMAVSFRKTWFRHAALLIAIASLLSCKEKTGKIPGADYDLGDVVIPGSMQEISHVFEFPNNTGKAIEIKRIVLSCSCASIDAPKIVAPMTNAKMKLKMLISRSDFAGRTASAVVETGPDNAPKFLLTLKARSAPLVFAKPSALEIGSIRSLDDLRMPLFVKKPLLNRKSDGIENVTSNLPSALEIRVLSQKVIRNQSRTIGAFDMLVGELEVTLHPRRLSGELSALINIRTLTGDSIDVPVNWSTAVN